MDLAWSMPTPNETASPAPSASVRRVALAQREQIQGWVRALAAGDRSVFAPLFEALWPIVRGVAASMLARGADADDAAQDALIKLAARVGEYDPARGDAVAWAVGITVYECRTWRQRARRRREEQVGSPAEFDGWLDAAARGAPSDPEATAVARDLQAKLGDLLGQLGPADLEVIAAALREDRTAADGATGATFRKRLQRALERLRRAWRSSHGDDD